jgi:hypothetical protein
MDLFGVAYTSEAKPSMTADDIDRLLVSARSNNAALGITGVLLFGDGRFFQYFEGTRRCMDDVYARIRESSLHRDVAELEHRQLEQRLFNRWFMGFREAPASVLQKLSQEQWQREMPWVEQHAPQSSGIRYLLELFAEEPDSPAAQQR